MEKVRIPREVAEAVKRISKKYERGYTVHMVLTNWSMLSEEHVLEYKVLSDYAAHHPIVYMTAIVNGYEIDETPEEKIKRIYGMYRSDHQETIRDVLDAFGHKIEGVNA